MVAHSKENKIHEKKYIYTTEKTHQPQVYVQCTTHVYIHVYTCTLPLVVEGAPGACIPSLPLILNIQFLTTDSMQKNKKYCK